MNLAVISLGSNINPAVNTAKARTLLDQRYSVVDASRFIETKPIGNPDQPDFLNGVVLIAATDDREAVEAQLKAIEATLGRDRSAVPYGPRKIDLDLVVWNGKVVHDDVREREFVRDAVNEVLPDLELPGD